MCAMEAALDHLGIGGFEGKHVVVEGAGGIGIKLKWSQVIILECQSKFVLFG